MSNGKIVRKILRTLPKRFAHKVTTIEEAQDLTTMKVDELVGNLTTFEMTFDESDSGKKKGLALKISTEEGDEDNLVQTMNMLAKSFNKTMRKLNIKSYGGNEGETGDDSDEEDLTQEELIENYKVLFCKWSKLTSVFTMNEAEKERLTKEDDELKKLVEIWRNEIVEWENKVKEFEKGIRMMNSSTNVLEEILTKGKPHGDNSGIGYAGSHNMQRVAAPVKLTYGSTYRTQNRVL
ncbi:hypothetical protein LIER_12963 [Lithospermum erythrorhizon]|uniref:Gag-pol polyprotein n=1 Tax=Lithospermum erythrorhizon TaxID=34254 RepID=A0AAV3PTR7_LITER